MSDKTTMAYRRLAECELIECSIPRSSLKQLFDVFDIEKTGFIDARELKAGLRALGVNLGVEQIREQLLKLSQDVNTPISFEIFCAIIEPNLPKKDSWESYQRLFESMGGHLTGAITFHHLQQICDELNEPISDQDLHRMIEEADTTGDGRVTFEEFARLMKVARDPLADLA